ncbi:lipase family protein [Neptunomonas qingdaonensis]|uniref:Lipase (Class 3) n=1 Tax=Neptunomonas qingdaonensis TaxID=1045558 RepID=A0A1I2LN91_9GAMM|nr:hypothetical protein [Neptunomonas qingdaonensis]SFF79930.1 Lipase (class 3) [Neptunomonas qingdaonensis]
MKKKIQSMTAEVAGDLAIYAMMSANAYKKKAKRVRFDLNKLGWQQVDLNGKLTDKPAKVHKISGLAYNIYEKVGTNKVVFAFRGTDSKNDYLWANLSVPPFNFQYRQARKAIRKYLIEHRNKDVVATGHSLGGGLALSVSVRLGVKAFAFDPSPRVFDGLGNVHKPAERVIVYQKGEILRLVRKLWKKDNEVVKRKNVYECNYPKVFKGKSKHRGDLLAKGLLVEGATANPELSLDLAFIVS